MSRLWVREHNDKNAIRVSGVFIRRRHIRTISKLKIHKAHAISIDCVFWNEDHNIYRTRYSYDVEQVDREFVELEQFLTEEEKE